LLFLAKHLRLQEQQHQLLNAHTKGLNPASWQKLQDTLGKEPQLAVLPLKDSGPLPLTKHVSIAKSEEDGDADSECSDPCRERWVEGVEWYMRMLVECRRASRMLYM